MQLRYYDELRGRKKQLFETCVRNGVEIRCPEKEETDEQHACHRVQLRKDCKDAGLRRRQANRDLELRDSTTKRQMSWTCACTAKAAMNVERANVHELNAAAMCIAWAAVDGEQCADVHELNATAMCIAWAAVDGEQCADVHELNATAMCIAWAAVDGEQCADVHELNATAMCIGGRS